jgi:nucleoid-associated protein YgaU
LSESTDLFDIPVPTETPKTENSVDLDDIENMESGFASPSADKTKEAVQAEKQKDVETLGAQKEQEKGEAAQKKEAARLKKDEARQKEKAALEKKQEVALEGDEILKEGDAVVETKHPAKQRNLSLVITAAELKNREIASHYVWKDRDDLESVAEKLYGDPALFPLLVDANEGDIILPDNLVRGTRLHVPRPPENDKKLDDIRRKSDKDPYRGWEGATLRRARH